MALKQTEMKPCIEHTCTEAFFIRITRCEIPQSRLWQNHSKGWYRANLSLFGAKLIDTRQKSMNDKHYTKDTLDFHIQPAKAAFIGWPFSRVIQEFHCSYFHELKLKMRTNQISLSVIKQYTLQKSGWFCRGGSVTRMQRRLSDTYAEEA